MANEIDVRELKLMADTILDHIINDLGIEKIQLKNDRDFYWDLPDDALYSVNKEQPKLDVGRLSDDYEFLAEIPRDKSNAVAFMLTHLAPLLRYVGQEVGQ